MSRTFIQEAGLYSLTQTYSVGDLVSAGGLGYVSNSYPNLGNPVTDAAHWTPIGSVDPEALALLARVPVVYMGGSGGSSKATPILNWAAPSAITYGSALSSAQLNCTSNALGTFTYSPAAGTVLSAGSHTLTVTFTPADPGVYTSATATVTLTVAQAVPVLTWPPPPSLLYTNALSAAQLNASASVAGTFAYSPAAGTTLPLGTSTLTATFTPADSANYTSATLTRSLTVTNTIPPPALIQSATGIGATGTAPVVLTLPAAPTPGHQITVLIGFQPSVTDYDFLPPDATWSYTLFGRTGPSANTYNRVAILQHTVVPGESATYTFYPVNAKYGNGVFAIALETSNTGAAQLTASTFSSGSGTQTPPPLVPAVLGSLPIAFDYLTFQPTLPSGWTLVTDANYFAAAVGPLTTDLTTSIDTVFTGYSQGNTIFGLLLLAPANPAATPVLSASADGPTRTVTLTAPTPGSTIFYTLDGSLPTPASAVYTAPLTIAATTNFGVLATAPGYTDSGVGLYEIPAGVGVQRVSLLPGGSWHGFVPFPNDLWHQPVDTQPVDSNSSAILALMSQTQNHLEPDGAIGFNVVDSTPGKPYTTPFQAFTANVSPVDSAGDYGCDRCPFPIPANLIVEDSPPPNYVSGADQHGLMVDRGTDALYELWHTTYGAATGSRPTYWASTAAIIFDLTRPDTLQHNYSQTTADAGGLSVLEGLARWDEVQDAINNGSMCLNHAIRMDSAVFGAASVGSSGYGYFQAPAMHSAPTGRQLITDADLIWYGMRIRLQASFDVSGYSLVNQVLLNTGKKFGWLLADIAPGHSFAFNYAQDPRWDSADLFKLTEVLATSLEVVQRGTILNGANYPRSASYVPAITSFTASASSVAAGTPVTLSALYTNGTFGFVQEAGLLRSGATLTVTPSVTTTYHLVVNGLNLVNDDGTGDGTRPTAALTLTVT